ncbi:putative membrane protein [Halobacteroides halobius DSM 5150]|uniref:Putative membrane protein n=1 Tax=Halobacteroides halobius (strain ATCC 35273 / DSM 5150 / MD-1) TaxID=748449 RepID=L0K547_HALHC|nr:DUF368 domain-containing protein [Halobacteroides halobius]AGB40382.1 putative membrane protein [Halobacteroides halobius DSM 5150]
MEEKNTTNKLTGFGELFLKGIPIGLSNTLPGISGGTLALVLGIYDQLVNGIKKIRLQVLIPIFLGAVTGVLSGSKIVTSLLETNPSVVKAFLLGLIIASSKVTYDQVKQVNLKTIILGIIGLVVAFIFSVELGGAGDVTTLSWTRLFLGGAVGSVAMILPGVSGGTILIMLGLYQGVLEAIVNFNFPVMIVFGLGVGSGLLSFSFVLSYLLDNYRSLLMSFLTGLILGSMRSVMSFNLGVEEILGFLLGVGVIYAISGIED